MGENMTNMELDQCHFKNKKNDKITTDKNKTKCQQNSNVIWFIKVCLNDYT